jgi:molybdate transport system ATP-binding protein
MDLKVDILVTQGDFVLDVDLHLKSSAVGIFGHSGSGKSTLLRCLSGLTKPRVGRIELDGEVLFDSTRKIWVPPHRRRIGMVFQDARLFPHWSVEKNLRAGDRHLAPEDKPYSAGEVIDLLKIEPLLKRSVRLLSGGEKQRVALARALLSYPRLLLMDEPVTGLDAVLKRQILPFLNAVHRELGVPCILVSHDMTEILQLSDELVLLEKGQLKGQGPLLELVKDPEKLQLLRGAGLMNVLRMVPLDHCEESGTSSLIPHTAGDNTVVIRTEYWPDLPKNETSLFGIAPSEISLALNPVEGISLQNQVSGKVRYLVETPERSLCVVDIGCPLMVEVTAQAVRELALRPGADIWCLFKACGVRRFN